MHSFHSDVLVMSASMMATWMPWNRSMRLPGTLFAATANIAPTRMGQHQLPMSAGIAAASEQTATQMPWSSPAFCASAASGSVGRKLTSPSPSDQSAHSGSCAVEEVTRAAGLSSMSGLCKDMSFAREKRGLLEEYGCI